MKIFLIGPLLVLFYAFLPTVLVGAWGDLFSNSVSKTTLIMGSSLSIAWNYYLLKNGTEIKIFRIPAWILAIVFFIMILFGIVS